MRRAALRNPAVQRYSYRRHARLGEHQTLSQARRVHLILAVLGVGTRLVPEVSTILIPISTQTVPFWRPG